MSGDVLQAMRPTARLVTLMLATLAGTLLTAPPVHAQDLCRSDRFIWRPDGKTYPLAVNGPPGATCVLKASEVYPASVQRLPLAIVSPPSFGRVSFGKDRSVVYRPSSSQPLEDTFTYQRCYRDGSNSGCANFQVNVRLSAVGVAANKSKCWPETFTLQEGVTTQVKASGPLGVVCPLRWSLGPRVTWFTQITHVSAGGEAWTENGFLFYRPRWPAESHLVRASICLQPARTQCAYISLTWTPNS